jgi:pyruvate dehydrogenase E2 component (dihydrolipoamide acetyltransferase)
LAREHGIELNKVKGSGPGGRVIERDLEPFLSKESKAEKAQVPGKPAAQEVPLSQMRKAIVRITTQSKAPVPHYYVTIEADMDEGRRFVEQSKKQARHISLSHLISAASARALFQHPGVNAAFAGETIKVFSKIDIGIAVALEDGLIVPVLRDCGGKTLQQIADAQRALVTRAKSRELTPEEYTGATFLISNLGMYDIESFIAVILPPAAAVLAVGSVREVPVIRNGKIEAGRRMKLTLSCDHRVIDGAVAAEFLQTLKHGLEHVTEL